MAAHDDSTGSGPPINRAVARIGAVLDDVSDVRAWSMNTVETRDALVGLSQASARLAEVEARLLAHAETLDLGGLDVAVWLANHTHLTPREAHLKVRLAAALDIHQATRDAVASGAVQPDQAMVIVEAVDVVPPEHRAQCETHLITKAAHHHSRELRRLGRHVLEVVDQETAAAHEAALLEKQEREAAASCRLTMSATGHGTVRGTFVLPTLQAEMLARMLAATQAPKHLRATGGTYDHDRPTPQRRGRAFAELIETYPTDLLPDLGGVNATVVVTMTLESLMGGLKAASLDTGESISAGEARRLACRAGLVPVVLGGASEILDLGREARFHTKPQRRAVRLAQHHCQHPGCDVPGHLCHVHHKRAWAKGATPTPPTPSSSARDTTTGPTVPTHRCAPRRRRSRVRPRCGQDRPVMGAPPDHAGSRAPAGSSFQLGPPRRSP